MKTTMIAAGLVAAAGALGAIPANAGDTTVQVTPWLRLEQHSPLIDVPHSFLSSPYHERVIMRVGNDWKQVFEATSNLAVPHLNPAIFNHGRSVFFDATVGAEGSFVLSENAPTPVVFKSTYCRRVAVRIDGETVLCLHGEFIPGDTSGYARMQLEVSAPSGKSLERISSKLPPNLTGPITQRLASPLAWSPVGNPIVQAEDEKAHQCIAVEIRAPAAREVVRLPGACPPPKAWFSAVQQAAPSPALPVPMIQGRWRAEGMRGQGEWRPWPSATCVRTDEYRADGTFSVWYGKQEMRGRYRIEPHSGGYMLLRSDPRFNAEADCRGVTPEAAAKEHFFTELGVEREGNRLLVYLPFTANRLELVSDQR